MYHIFDTVFDVQIPLSCYAKKENIKILYFFLFQTLFFVSKIKIASHLNKFFLLIYIALLGTHGGITVLFY